ncbi:unnamed protein product [Coregonus sp. 'balchen']|nr:unnamed protein product [Coregonus sp. 'balchen']
MSTVKDDLAQGKENQGPNALKMKKEAVKVQPLSQTTGTLCSTTKKQSSTNGNTLRLLSAASVTARLNVLKGMTKTSAVAPCHSASLKTAPARSQSTVPTKRCPGTTNHLRTQPNPAVKICNTRPSSAKPLANAVNQQGRDNLSLDLNPPSKAPAGPGPKTAATKPGDRRTTETSGRVSIQEVERIQRAPSQHRAEARGAGPNTQIWKPASRASTGITGNQWQAKALRRAMHAAVAEMGQKSSGEENRGRVESRRADTDTKNEPNAPSPSSASPACWPRPNRSTVNGVWIPQMVPRSARVSSHGQEEVGWEAGVGLKTPRDQARKLQEWRENRGISYKRPPMPVRPPRVRRTVALPQAYWDGMEEEVEAKSLVGVVDRCLADCIKLLIEGCPSSQVQEMLSTVPMAEKFSKYWICQARLMERQGNLDVLPLFEEAVRVVLEPVDELRTVVFEMLKKKEERQGQSPIASAQEPVSEEDDVLELDSTPDPMATPTAVKALIRGDRGGSSVVKYKITATPGGFRSQQREATLARMVDGQELRFFTPVRRSVRIERSVLLYPASLQEHDHCVASFNDLMAQEDEREGEGGREGDGEGGGSAGPIPNDHLYVYRENEALRDKVNIQLVYAEEED